MSFAEALKTAKPAHRDISLCLNGELRAQWDKYSSELLEAEAQLASEQENNSGRLSAPSEAKSKIKTLEKLLIDLKPEIAKASITLRFTALPFVKWNELVIDNPPRDGDVADRMWGYNTLTFYPAAMRLTGSAVEAGKTVEITEEQWEQLEEVLTDRMMDDVAGAINVLNRQEGTSIPFSLADFEKTAD